VGTAAMDLIEDVYDRRARLGLFWRRHNDKDINIFTFGRLRKFKLDFSTG
jgi:hypothetical protein